MFGNGTRSKPHGNAHYMLVIASSGECGEGRETPGTVQWLLAECKTIDMINSNIIKRGMLLKLDGNMPSVFA